MNIEDPITASGEIAIENGTDMRFVGTLVRRKPRVAVDTKNGSLRVGEQWYPILPESLSRLDDKSAQRNLQLGFIDSFARAEPFPIVVFGEAA